VAELAGFPIQFHDEVQTMAMRKGPARSVERERFWRGLVEGWRRSGLSVRQWCAKHHVSEPSFYAWHRELQRRDARGRVSVEASPLLLPVTIAAGPSAPSAAPLEIELPGAVRLHVRPDCDPALLAEAIRALRDREHFSGESEPC
jgi:hypothetical protein